MSHTPKQPPKRISWSYRVPSDTQLGIVLWWLSQHGQSSQAADALTAFWYPFASHARRAASTSPLQTTNSDGLQSVWSQTEAAAAVQRLHHQICLIQQTFNLPSLYLGTETKESPGFHTASVPIEPSPGEGMAILASPQQVSVPKQLPQGGKIKQRKQRKPSRSSGATQVQPSSTTPDKPVQPLESLGTAAPPSEPPTYSVSVNGFEDCDLS